MSTQLKVLVGKDGKLTLSVTGSTGPQCVSLTEFLENEMGEVLERQKTESYYQSAHIHTAHSVFHKMKT
jgi:hypothetical protein